MVFICNISSVVLRCTHTLYYKFKTEEFKVRITFVFQHSTEICSNYKPVAIGSTSFQNVVGIAFMIDVSNLLYFTIGRLRC